VYRIKVKRISPKALGKALALVFFGLGVIASILGFLSRGTGAELTVGAFVEFSGAAARNPFVLILLPFLEALFGFIAGVVLAWLYNVAADRGAAIEYHGDIEGYDRDGT
jgi:uncharacterized membrane protein YccC